MIDCVLIANRGEIAVRIARTVRGLGGRVAAVFVDADEQAPHVAAADVAVRISSYLAATGAEAVHPGYGFLSESATFAHAVADAGLTWIGPPASAIELMGDKGAAKAAAHSAGVPVVPEGSVDELPLVVKAVAGGGGKGMRVVRRAQDLEEATAAAQREAQAQQPGVGGGAGVPRVADDAAQHEPGRRHALLQGRAAPAPSGRVQLGHAQRTPTPAGAAEARRTVRSRTSGRMSG